MMYSISILGPVEVRYDGEVVALPAGKTTELLVRLALDAGVTIRAERLLEDLWGESDSTEINTLHSKVSMLRRALGDSAAVTGGRNGYTLNVDPSSVDAIEIQRVATFANDCSTRGEHRAAVDACGRALEMFRGDILSGAGEGDWVNPHRVHLEEVQLGLVHDLLAARLELGDAAEVIGELEALVARHPLRESLWVLLITALYRSNRQVDALAAYQRVRTHLSDEMGLFPGPQLQALERQVLVHDPALDGIARGPTASSSVNVGNLPALASQLVGRDTDVEQVSGLLTHGRLVSVVGPAGVGKTRLAVEIARRHQVPGGAWLVRLDTTRAPSAIPQVVGAAFGLVGATEAMILDRVRATEILVVLDNCEHVLEPAADLCARLLDAAPRLRILVTSQVPLGLDGEIVHVLEPLAMADSMTLFAQRATDRRTSFRLDADTAAAVEEVCRSLDGLPLAIELAAARTKALSVQEIARRLEDRFSLLSDPSGRRQERHRALSTAIGWSYDLLFPDEQNGLCALAWFADGAPLAAAEHVAVALGVPAASTVDVFARLADRSLVTADIATTGEVRYRLLDSVGAFARGRLDEAGLTDRARAAHAEWFEMASVVALDEQRTAKQARHVAFLRTERANLDAALGWTAANDPAHGLRIALGFGWASVILGEGGIGAERLRLALHACGSSTTDADRALALSLIAWNESGADIERASADATLSIEIADRTGDHHVITASRFASAFVLFQRGHTGAAIDLLERWHADAQPETTVWDRGMHAILLGFASFAAGDSQRAGAAGAEAERLLPLVGDDWLASHFEAILGQLAQIELRYPDAAAHLTRAAQAARRSHMTATEGFHLASLGVVLHQSGDHETAIATFEEAIRLATAVGLMRIAAFTRVRLGTLLHGLGEVEPARAALSTADEWFRASGGGAEAALAQCLLAAMDADDGLPDAEQRLVAILNEARADVNLDVQVFALDALAGIDARAGNIAAALDLLASADELMQSLGHRIAEHDRIDARRARELTSEASTRHRRRP
jgi:predicted ATPase/DNA-binding SARP family transcriptional activator